MSIDALTSELPSMDERFEARERTFGKTPSGRAAAVRRFLRTRRRPLANDGGCVRRQIRDPHDVRGCRLAAGRFRLADRRQALHRRGPVFPFSVLNGEPLANDGSIQRRRGGAGADSRAVGMLGGMARAEAFCAVRDIERTTIYSPAKREKKCVSAPSGESGIGIVTVAAAREAPGRIDVKVRQGDAGRGNEPRSAPEERGRGAPTAFIAGAGEEVKRLRPRGGRRELWGQAARQSGLCRTFATDGRDAVTELAR